jgi:hypothetical protein
VCAHVLSVSMSCCNHGVRVRWCNRCNFGGHRGYVVVTQHVCTRVCGVQVQPFSGIIDSVTVTTPRVLFNRDRVGPFRHNSRKNDIAALG